MKRIATAISFAIATASLGATMSTYAQVVPAVYVQPVAVQGTVVRVRYVGPFDAAPAHDSRGTTIATGHDDVEIAVKLRDGEIRALRVDGARQPRLGATVTVVAAGGEARIIE